LSLLKRLQILKKMVKEAERMATWQEDIYTALHNIHADWIVSGVLALARIPNIDWARISANFPRTIAELLSDHHKAAHDALGIDADTVDGAHAGNAANKVPILDASALLPLAQIPATLTGKDADTVDGQHRALKINADHSHASSGAEGGQVSHGSLTGVASDQHHAQAHTLASHSTKAHAELTGVGADDHHARSHDHSLAADGSPIAEGGVPNHMSKNKLAWTADKLLKGAGAGADPTEIDVPEGLPTWAVGDILVIYANSEKSTSSGGMVKLKEIVVASGGNIRVKFDLKSAGTYTVYGQIYKNGAAFGTLRTKSDPAYTTYSEDLSFSAGDTVELWARTTEPTCAAFVRNFQLYADKKHLHYVSQD
jgi:hypothetical protein